MISNFSIIFTLFLHIFSYSFAPSYKHLAQRYSIHGIDLSHHQKNIDWDILSEQDDFKVSFCFLKATEGATFQDTKFQNYWKKCRNAGIPRGAYHFFHPSKTATEQAKNFINSVRLQDGDLAPVLDFEKDSPSANVTSVRKNLSKWIQIVQKHYGIKPIIYTNVSIYNKYIKGHFKDNTLWLADYKSNNIHDSVKSPNLRFWQYTEKGRLSGISGHVDINAFMGEKTDFENLKIGNANTEIEIEIESVSSR